MASKSPASAAAQSLMSGEIIYSPPFSGRDLSLLSNVKECIIEIRAFTLQPFRTGGLIDLILR